MLSNVVTVVSLDLLARVNSGGITAVHDDERNEWVPPGERLEHLVAVRRNRVGGEMKFGSFGLLPPDTLSPSADRSVNRFPDDCGFQRRDRVRVRSVAVKCGFPHEHAEGERPATN
jgi:hypothetical protein